MSASLSMSAAIRAVLGEAMEASEAVVLLGETVGRMGGSAGTSAGLLEAYGPLRVRDLPVADRGTLGLALGMALAGHRPVVELSSTRRLTAGAEVLAEAAAIAQRGDFAVPLVVRVPCGTESTVIDGAVGRGGALTPGLTVVCASSPGMAAGLLRTALKGTRPVVLLEPRSSYDDRGPVDDQPAPFTARVLRDGDHITLAAWGVGVEAAVQAAEALSADGISAEVVDLVALNPIDRQTLSASVRKTGRLVVVHPEDAALADAARAVGLDDAFLYLESPLVRASEAPGAVAAAARQAVAY